MIMLTHLKFHISILFLDIDECQAQTDDCEGICENTIGSFLCSCEPGYQMNDENNCMGK